MASIETSGNAEKAEVEKILSTEAAKSLVAEEALRRDEPSVVGQVTNNRGGTLKLLATASWVGKFFSAPPASVGAEKINFSHKGTKGAIIYGEQQGSNPAAYLLAWSFTGGPFQVYVKCGPVSEVLHDGWESAALASVNASGTDSSAKDDGTSSSAHGHIQDATGTFPLGAVFGKFN
ncbi:hypothetical protein vseg_021649 [Gypsophila vaccaria]